MKSLYASIPLPENAESKTDVAMMAEETVAAVVFFIQPIGKPKFT
jgi:hypothetical protein